MSVRSSKPCARCGRDTPLTEFVRSGRNCPECREATATPAPRPCFRCQVPKLVTEFPYGKTRRRRRSVCKTCRRKESSERRARTAAKRVTWEIDGVLMRRCSNPECHQIKPLEECFYVSRRKADGSPSYDYRCKACQVARVSERVKRMASDPATRDALIANRRRWQREWRKKHSTTYHEAQLRWRIKVKADPERHAARLETNRMSYRLRQERQRGVHLDDIRHVRPKHPAHDDWGGHLPVAPLAEVVGRRLACVPEAQRDFQLEAWGINDRIYYAWRKERTSVQARVAERMLCAMELNWWDVWPAAEYPEVAELLS